MSACVRYFSLRAWEGVPFYVQSGLTVGNLIEREREIKE